MVWEMCVQGRIRFEGCCKREWPFVVVCDTAMYVCWVCGDVVV